MKIPEHLNCLLKQEKVFRVSSAVVAYAHTICQSEFEEFRIQESFSVESTNCTVKPLTFVRFSAFLEIGSLSRGLILCDATVTLTLLPA